VEEEKLEEILRVIELCTDPRFSDISLVRWIPPMVAESIHFEPQ